MLAWVGPHNVARVRPTGWLCNTSKRVVAICWPSGEPHAPLQAWLQREGRSAACGILVCTALPPKRTHTMRHAKSRLFCLPNANAAGVSRMQCCATHCFDVMAQARRREATIQMLRTSSAFHSHAPLGQASSPWNYLAALSNNAGPEETHPAEFSRIKFMCERPPSNVNPPTQCVKRSATRSPSLRTFRAATHKPAPPLVTTTAWC